jgi:aspartate carbamoyltransferase catalytic subunit
MTEPNLHQFTTTAQRDSRFAGQHILSVQQFDQDALAYVFQVAEEYRQAGRSITAQRPLEGYLMANLFYEPSTRTASSFQAAMQRLGGTVIPINEVHYSSVAKGESLPDTIRTLEAYTDVIVLRHPEIGAAAQAAHFARKPIINAGDGAGEHPTQALLDLFTIFHEQGRIDGLTITLLGDLKNGRTVHSLARLASLFNVRLNFVAPDILRMPPDLLAQIHRPQQQTTLLEDVLAETDVLYVTRIQKERFTDLIEYESVKESYVITPEIMQHAPPKMTLMHPFPRVGEIHILVDQDPRAAYFRQIEYGMYVRMALLAMVLGKV